MWSACLVRQERSLRVAFVSLLNIVCDAVVELDGSHRIVQHEPRLAHVLLHGHGKSLQGAKLQEFMPDVEDQQSLEQRISDLQCERKEVATMFHVRTCVCLFATPSVRWSWAIQRSMIYLLGHLRFECKRKSPSLLRSCADVRSVDFRSDFVVLRLIGHVVFGSPQTRVVSTRTPCHEWAPDSHGSAS